MDIPPSTVLRRIKDISRRPVPDASATGHSAGRTIIDVEAVPPAHPSSNSETGEPTCPSIGSPDGKGDRLEPDETSAFEKEAEELRVKAFSTAHVPGEKRFAEPVETAAPPVKASQHSVALTTPGGDASSLPVLEAIQAFLAEERAATQRRVRSMLLAFTAVMAAAIFIGGIVVWRYMSDVKRDLLAAVVDPKPSDDEADAAATKAIRLVSRAAESFEEKLRRERTAMLGIRTGVDSRLNSQSAEIESIRALLAQMKADNSFLKGELGEIRAAALNAPKQETKPAIAGSPLQFLIKPRDGVPAATWRLPLPE